MGPIDCPKTTVWNYHSILRKIPEESIFQLYSMLREANVAHLCPLFLCLAYRYWELQRKPKKLKYIRRPMFELNTPQIQLQSATAWANMLGCVRGHSVSQDYVASIFKITSNLLSGVHTGLQITLLRSNQSTIQKFRFSGYKPKPSKIRFERNAISARGRENSEKCKYRYYIQNIPNVQKLHPSCRGVLSY